MGRGSWPRYVALGDSLTAGRDDLGPDGTRIGWARRLAGMLGERTGVPCTLANLARDGASVEAVLAWQLPSLEPATAAMTLFGPYDFKAIRFRARGVASNRCPIGAHRGVGMDAGVFATERMMDEIAADLGVDPLELRRLNAVRELPRPAVGTVVARTQFGRGWRPTTSDAERRV